MKLNPSAYSQSPTTSVYGGQAVKPSGPELITVRAAARRYSVSEVTIRKWIQRDWLPSVRFGRKCVRIPRKLADQRLTGTC